MASAKHDTLGTRLAQARRELGVRLCRDVLQSDVADALEVGAATVSRWEADQAVPREAALARLAAYLEVTPAYLRYGELPGSVAPDPALDRKVTPGEIEAARSLAARLEAKQKKKTPNHNHG